MAAQSPQFFYWTEAADVLRGLLPLSPGPEGRTFVSLPDAEEPVEFVPPPLLPVSEDTPTPEAYLERLARPIGLQLIILIQAGATSMGLWREDELLVHKVIKKYVTRGKGRSQTTYLKTRGKSRYGSRLRLQNARDHLIETNERLCRWWETHGAFDRIYTSCPVRMWPELFHAKVLPPFPRDVPRIRIARDVRVPGHQELLKVRGFLCNGQVRFRSQTE
ncbi:MAG: hypothetical protein QNK37_15175 [Acidobacteriota bacterium]|nr:hypothetical protein [Acidobacteriota bacterium]